MSRYVRVDRGSGSRPGQLLRHKDDPNRWLVAVFLGRDADGKRQRISEVVYGRKRDAEARLTELLQSKNQGKLRPRTRATVKDVTGEWLKQKALEVTPRTLAGYETALELYVLPSIGHRRVTDLTLKKIENLYANMRTGKLPKAKDGTGWQGKPLGARTVQLAHTALSQALSQAVRHGTLSYNPAAEAVLTTSKPKEKRTLSIAERVAFLENADAQDAFHRVLYRALMDTGMRPGEACALTWADLDFAAERITISKAVTQDEDGRATVAAPKTLQSRRTIPMFGLGEYLQAHYRWQAEHGLDDLGHVFTNQNGGMVTPWALNKRELNRILASAGIGGRFTLYGFRHTFATLHLQSGTPLKVVSDWLGHSTIQQTANTYQHLSQEISTDYADRHVEWLKRAERAAKEAPVN